MRLNYFVSTLLPHTPENELNSDGVCKGLKEAGIFMCVNCCANVERLLRTVAPGSEDVTHFQWKDSHRRNMDTPEIDSVRSAVQRILTHCNMSELAEQVGLWDGVGSVPSQRTMPK